MMYLPPVASGPLHLDTVHHTDLLTLCAVLPDRSIDLILCDLPYGAEKTKCDWDARIPLQALWIAFRRLIHLRGAIVLTSTQPFTSELIMSNPEMFRYCWYWEKPRGSNYGNCHFQPLRIIEEVLIFSPSIASPNQFTNPSQIMRYFPQNDQLDKPYTRKVEDHHVKVVRPSLSSHVHNSRPYTHHYITSTAKNLLYAGTDSERGLHPTQKPVALFEYLIRTYTQPGDVVLDPCVGSGTTAIAARNTGRRWICGDSDAGYVQVAKDRLATPYTPMLPGIDTPVAAPSQAALFEVTP